MNATRINTRFIVGTNDMNEHILNDIVGRLSAKYGGLTYQAGLGMWAENGDQDNVEYAGIAHETAHIFDISCVVADHDLDFMKQCFIPVVEVATWVHCETWLTNAHHFDVKALYAQIAGN